MDNGEFRFPTVRVGDSVEVWTDPKQGQSALGLVLQVKSTAITAFCITPLGYSVQRDVWHKDDPRVIQKPHVFDRGDRGIFVQTEWTLMVATLMQLVTELKRCDEAKSRDISELREQIERLRQHREDAPNPDMEAVGKAISAAPSDQPLPKRGRGRPRKYPLPAEA